MSTQYTMGEYFWQKVREEEGIRNIRYFDTKGIPTIGVGYNLTESYAKFEIESLGYNYDDVLSGVVSIGKMGTGYFSIIGIHQNRKPRL